MPGGSLGSSSGSLAGPLRRKRKARFAAVMAASSLLLGMALSASMWILSPLPVTACAGRSPSATYVAKNADSIILARVLESRWNANDLPVSYRLEKLRDLKGRSDQEILEIPASASSLCGDLIHAREGSRLVLAFDVSFLGSVLTPYWLVEDDGSVVDGPSVTREGWSLSHLFDTIARSLPESATATAEPSPALTGGQLLIATGSLLLAVSLFQRRRSLARV